MPMTLLPTTVVGSYPQPEWLVDRALLTSKMPPRVRAKEIWRIPEQFLEQAQDDATILAIRDMERAGIDIITDGEIRRESYSNRFATALEGIDLERPGETVARTGNKSIVPRVVGKIRRKHAVEMRDVEFLRKNTNRTIKITVPGPFTMAQQTQNDFYKDEEEMAFDYAIALNEELRDLKAAGADVLQIDDPWLQARPEAANRYGVKVINRALQGIPGPTVVHLCFGYAYVVFNKPAGYTFLAQLADCSVEQISIEAAQPNVDFGVLKALSNKKMVLGMISLGDNRIESADEVAARVRNALKHIPAERLILAPDCGMKYLARDVAFGKLKALADGAAIVRREL
ncbi:MAG: uroporphyrinogen decarboxylase family protein [Burkholderiales bacterium]